MRAPSTKDDLIRQFLLGGLNGDERIRFEARVMTEPAFRAWVLMVEDELVDDYVAGLLSTDEREKFVKGYLTTHHQIRKLKIAKALSESADEYVAPRFKVTTNSAAAARGGLREFIKKLRGRRRIWRLITTSLAVVLLAGVLLAGELFRRWYAHESNIRELAWLNSLQYTGPAPGSGGSVLTVALTPVKLRGSESRGVSIPEYVKVVRLRLEAGGGRHRGYRARIHRVDDEEEFTVETQRSEQDGTTVVIFNIPARLLSRGDYQLALSGLTEQDTYEELADYTFRVSSRDGA